MIAAMRSYSTCTQPFPTAVPETCPFLACACWLVCTRDVEKGRLPTSSATASVRFDKSAETARGSGRFFNDSTQTAKASIDFDQWRGGAEGSRSSKEGEAWTTGPMKGWAFRASQVQNRR